jgi:nicotinamide mononucleotide transporter
MNPYEATAVAFGILSVWLIARQRVWGWPVGLVNVVLFIVVFRDARLYAAMGLQVVYVVLLLYGWRAWAWGGEHHQALAVSRTPRRLVAPLLLAGAVGALALGTFLHRETDASLPFLDAILTAFSLVAQGMQARKWVENWLVWFVVDVVYVGMYLYKQLFLTAGLYAVFLGLAVMGWIEWRRTLARAAATC